MKNIFLILLLCISFTSCIVMGKDIRILSSDGKEITGAKDIGQGNLAEIGKSTKTKIEIED